MSNFTTIALTDLDLVTGGEGEDTGIFGPGAGPNRENIEGSAGFQTPVGVKVEGSGKYQTTASDQQACIQTAIKNGADPLAAVKACR
ncbi:MAG TPA: hypothetical protein VF516_20865 [Kofleriaceae bacterium]